MLKPNFEFELGIMNLNPSKILPKIEYDLLVSSNFNENPHLNSIVFQILETAKIRKNEAFKTRNEPLSAPFVT